MALILGTIDNYVVEGYIEDQNSYVLGPAASNFAVTVQAETQRLILGSATLDAGTACDVLAGFTLETDTVCASETQQTTQQNTLVQTTVFAEAFTTQAATAEQFVGSPANFAVTASVTVSGEETTTGSAVMSTAWNWWNNPAGGPRTAKTITNNNMVNGGPQISTTVFRTAPGSMWLNQTLAESDNWIATNTSTDFSFGNGDYTIEFWFRRTANDGESWLLDTRGALGTGSPWLQISNAGRVRFGHAQGSDPVTTYESASGTVVNGTWYHIAVTRTSGTRRVFLNGQLLSGSQATETASYTLGTFRVLLGNNAFDTNSGAFNGYIDEVHVVRGQSLYTANFTPTAKAQPTANTVLYLEGDAFTDTVQRNNVNMTLSPDTTVFAAQATQTTDSGQTIQGEVAIAGAMSAEVTLRGDLPGDINTGITAVCEITPELVLGTEITCDSTAAVSADGDPFVFVTADWTSESEFSSQGTVVLSTATMVCDAQFEQNTEASKGIVHLAQAQFTATTTQAAEAVMTYTLAGELPNYTWADTEPTWPDWPDEIWGTLGTRRLGAKITSDQTGTVLLSTAQATLDTVFDCVAGSVNTKPGAVSLSTQAQLSGTASVTQQAVLAVSAVTGLEAELRFVVLASVSADMSTTVSVIPNYTAGIQEQWTAVSTVTVLGGQDGSFTSTPASEFACSAQAQVLHQAQALATATAELNCFAATEDRGIVITAWTSEVNATAAVTWYAQTLTDLSTQQTTVAAITNSADCDWQAFNSTLITGREDQADPYRILAIHADTRVLRVIPDTRRLAVCSQTRVLRVPQPAYIAEQDRRVA